MDQVSATQSRIYVYDSNYPENAERYITLSTRSDGTYTGWYYKVNDKYDWGSAFPGCRITYIPYEDYKQVWDERASKSAVHPGGASTNFELLTVNDNVCIRDTEGIPIATIQDGKFVTGRDDMFPMMEIGLTLDEDETQNRTASVWLPADLYTVERTASTSGASLLSVNEPFEASMTHMEQSASVSTTASSVTFAVNDSEELNMVSIDGAEEGETYEIKLESSLESAENREISLTGTVLAKALTFMQVGGEAYYSGITAEGSSSGVTKLTLDGQEFVPAGNTESSLFVVSFTPNGGSGTMSPQTAQANGTFTLPECTFTAPEGMEFDCWLVNQSEYLPGESCTLTENTAVTAQWKPVGTQARAYTVRNAVISGGNVTVEVANRSGSGGVLMVAAYAENGKFIGCEMKSVEESLIAQGASEKVTVSMELSGAKTVRAFMMESGTQKVLSRICSADAG